MKVIVNGKLEDLGAHIYQIEEGLVPNFELCGYEHNQDGYYVLPDEDYAMWNEACEASDNLDDLYRYCKDVFGWNMF